MLNYYFDANALIKCSTLQEYKARLGEAEKGVDEIRQLVSQEDSTIYYSSLTLLECWRVLFLFYRKGILGKSRSKHANRALQIIVEKLMEDLQSPFFVKLDTSMDENVIGQAHLLIERYGKSRDIGSVDMLHIALNKGSSIENLFMVNSDRVVKNVCISEGIGLFDPENPIVKISS